MSLAAELTKISLSQGYSRFVDSVKKLMVAAESAAREGRWECEVAFEGSWYEDEGNQKALGVLLSDQDLYLVDVTQVVDGSKELLFHVTWGEELEWRKGRREERARRVAI